MDYFGNMRDAFADLRHIGEHGGNLRDWAEKLAQLLGEESNLSAVWPDGKLYYTVDVPHRTLSLTVSDCGDLIDESGQTYPHWMVRPL